MDILTILVVQLLLMKFIVARIYTFLITPRQVSSYYYIIFYRKFYDLRH